MAERKFQLSKEDMSGIRSWANQHGLSMNSGAVREEIQYARAAKKIGVINTYQSTIIVDNKSGIPDPQGQDAERSLKGLGFEGVGGVKSGQLFEVTHTAPNLQAAQENAATMTDKLLANPVYQQAREITTTSVSSVFVNRK